MQKRLIILFGLIIALFFACNTVKFAGYVRVYDNDTLIYHFTKDNLGRLLFYDDTLICKMIVRKGVVRKKFYQNHDVFYFESLNFRDTVPGNIFTFDIPLNQFTYYFEKGSLFMGGFVLRDTNPTYEPFEKVIPEKIKPGQPYVFKDDDYRKVFTFLKSENILLGKVPVKKALKFSIAFTSRQGIKTTDTVWLAKTWGYLNGRELMDIPGS